MVGAGKLNAKTPLIFGWANSLALDIASRIRLGGLSVGCVVCVRCLLVSVFEAIVYWGVAEVYFDS